MFRTLGTLLLVASATWPGSGARAADTESAPQCAQIETDAQRLACYDQLFGAPVRTGKVEASVITPATATAPVAVGETDRRDFGLNEADKRRNVNLPAAPESVTVTIQSVDRRPTGEQVFKTREGQTWVEVEPSSRLRVAPGDDRHDPQGSAGFLHAGHVHSCGCQGPTRELNRQGPVTRPGLSPPAAGWRPGAGSCRKAEGRSLLLLSPACPIARPTARFNRPRSSFFSDSYPQMPDFEAFSAISAGNFCCFPVSELSFRN